MVLWMHGYDDDVPSFDRFLDACDGDGCKLGVAVSKGPAGGSATSTRYLVTMVQAAYCHSLAKVPGTNDTDSRHAEIGKEKNLIILCCLKLKTVAYMYTSYSNFNTKKESRSSCSEGVQKINDLWRLYLKDQTSRLELCFKQCVLVKGKRAPLFDNPYISH